LFIDVVMGGAGATHVHPTILLSVFGAILVQGFDLAFRVMLSVGDLTTALPGW